MDRNTRPRHNFWMEQVFDPEEIANIGPRSLVFATAVDLWLSRSSCTILTISRQWFVEMSAARCGALDHGLIFPLKLPWFLFSSADCRFVPGKSFAPSTIIAMKSARRHRTVEWIIWWDMWKMEWNKMNPGEGMERDSAAWKAFSDPELRCHLGRGWSGLRYAFAHRESVGQVGCRSLMQKSLFMAGVFHIQLVNITDLEQLPHSEIAWCLYFLVSSENLRTSFRHLSCPRQRSRKIWQNRNVHKQILGCTQISPSFGWSDFNLADLVKTSWRTIGGCASVP